MTTKVTLDQVLGGILWQVALLSINEPYRVSAVALWDRVTADARKRLPLKKSLNTSAVVAR